MSDQLEAAARKAQRKKEQWAELKESIFRAGGWEEKTARGPRSSQAKAPSSPRKIDQIAIRPRRVRAKKVFGATKSCPKCSQELPLASFGLRSSGQPLSYCRICSWKSKWDLIKANPERLAVNLAERRVWRSENRDKIRESEREWRRRNPEIVRASRIKKSAKRRGAIGASWVSPVEIGQIVESQGGKCVYCRTKFGKYHIDHIMPLALGGRHERSNLQALCPRCNNKKHAKHPVDFARSLGLLL